MLIVDEAADIAFMKALEGVKSRPDTTSLIHLKLSDKPALRNQPALHEIVLDATNTHLHSLNPAVYFLEDGDIVISVASMATREARQAILRITAYLNHPATEDLVSLFEASPVINKLLLGCEKKLEQKRLQLELKKKEVERDLAERRRYALLNQKPMSDSVAASISKRRAARTTPMFMMIEDDAFSRKLVETVLRNRYPITSLGDAEGAIDTYAALAPDILFLDINLPDVTGHDLLERFIAIDPDAYIIMISGNADRDNIMHAMQHGAKGFIGKPFPRDKLFQYIERCPTLMGKTTA